MHRRTVTEIEERASLSVGACGAPRVAIASLITETKTTRAVHSSSVDFAREVELRGDRSARMLRAEIVVHSRAMSYAK